MDMVWQKAAHVLGGIFNYHFSALDVPLVFTLILLEGVLSFDNAAILAVMTRRLPKEQRGKALTYGLIGAYTFRFLAVIFAAVLLSLTWTKILGGIYLIYLCISHFIQRQDGEETPEMFQNNGLFGLSAFWSAVISIEVADAVFAVDQILVAIAYTEKYILILAASVVAILVLRISALILTKVIEWFPPLEQIAYGVVGLVGVKLIASYWGLEMEHNLSLVLTLGAFLIPISGKIIFDLMIKTKV